MVKVLFVCVHNSARSQMAEAYLNSLGAGRFIAESAGLEPGSLNPLVVEVMQEKGIDISGNATKSVQHMLDKGNSYDAVIAVCDGANASRCPVFPGTAKVIHWSFSDPSELEGSDEEILEGIRIIRDQIKNRLEKWIKERG